MNIPTSAALSLGAVYALHRITEPAHSIENDFITLLMLMALGVACIVFYILSTAKAERRRLL